MATKKTEKPLHGTVKWFARNKGFGFIAGEDGRDYFVHQSEIQVDGFRKLKAEQKVTFIPNLEAEKGPTATAVCV